ncbi:hypothetical protein BDV96DRAFT_642800 [Lophiotrema nucula]|uniref:Uncharacterized protein n=1 Tax=Lophiotrema nucula TaxID=690887 RepID=A0A6A5ZJM3_9PLEO|nr:hypothetical protein BDV96DRAFT_642800 [Lophiotrema nucula]
MTTRSSRITGLNYAIFLTSFILLGLSIAIIVLEAKVLTAFQDRRIQYPTSSLAEWLFINLNPNNIDGGPTIGIFVAGATGLVTSLATMLWTVGTWLGWSEHKMKHWGLATTLITFVNTAVSLAVLVYVYVTEASAKTPEYVSQWGSRDYTREHYVCKMVPDALEGGKQSAVEIWGFRPCDYAKAARYELVAVASVAVLLTCLSIVEAWRSGAWRMVAGSEKEDIEKAAVRANIANLKRRKELFLSNGVQTQPSQPRPARDSNVQVHVQIQQRDATQQVAWSQHYEWYGKL